MSRSGRHLQFGAFTGRVSLLLAALSSFVVMQPLYAAQKSSKNTAAAQTSADDARAQANIDTVMAFYKAAANADFEQARQYVGYYYIEHDPASEDGIAGLQKALSPNRMGARKTFTIERLVGDGEYVIFDAKLSPVMGGPPPAANTGAPGGVSASGPPGGGPPAGGPPGGGPPGGGAAPAGGGAPPGGAARPGAPSGASVPPEFRPTDVAEIFRLFDGKIVEHWKIIQQS